MSVPTVIVMSDSALCCLADETDSRYFRSDSDPVQRGGRTPPTAAPTHGANDQGTPTVQPAPGAIDGPDSAEVLPMPNIVDVDRFYHDLLEELAAHARRGGTAIGAAVVVRRVATEHGVSAASRLPLPRLSRAIEDELGVRHVSKRRAREWTL